METAIAYSHRYRTNCFNTRLGQLCTNPWLLPWERWLWTTSEMHAYILINWSTNACIHINSLRTTMESVPHNQGCRMATGNCLFSAIALQLFTNDTNFNTHAGHTMRLRRLAVQYLLEHTGDSRLMHLMSKFDSKNINSNEEICIHHSLLWHYNRA